MFVEEEGSVTRPAIAGHGRLAPLAFEAATKENPGLAQAKPLSFSEWAAREGKEPDTYVKPKAPSRTRMRQRRRQI